ncbi:hypothetical protein [Streptomyces tremellae]|uniref:Uncharacterized protein n=1 Tax=Streptomyces tremellae TaxID=1124239 RepID=A0ABP7DQ96_9ACTN
MSVSAVGCCPARIVDEAGPAAGTIGPGVFFPAGFALRAAPWRSRTGAVEAVAAPESAVP